ncbi:DUF2559 family protein [Pasteurella skyensis]|uniref:DUF2559 family protein n=1 Tax=Phocoenobacter skyensis TaxID=97481 RepID=A0AAJ6P0E7_9PAST|nr:YhfG family protein [Pasteurella skyensis]MDP8162538.1 DUF2559 family protein [Pasteurella skyensis]MDP8172503.1 DUF2559 family protein [Pasteurella skyensis]MDP8177528.1 DUF2559 family protein [Pasteurella skyensis]MDP8178758.1 DUF2559 family protein [Pasteurella skyensis]MDP8182952.1 DUF2559 family protein [Pasteurella skyensis]
MKAQTILQVKNIEELQALGSYLEVKRCLENEIDIKLKIKGWSAFYQKILLLKKGIFLVKDNIDSIFKEKNFLETKRYFSEVLGIEVQARSWAILKLKLAKLVNLLISNSCDPYEYYEKTKLKKFQDSSRLEGINITFPSKSVRLENILAKYRR